MKLSFTPLTSGSTAKLSCGSNCLQISPWRLDPGDNSCSLCQVTYSLWLWKNVQWYKYFTISVMTMFQVRPDALNWGFRARPIQCIIQNPISFGCNIPFLTSTLTSIYTGLWFSSWMNIIAFMLRVLGRLEVRCLTGVEVLRMAPLLLIVMQRPQVDDNSSSFLNFEISNTDERKQFKSLCWYAWKDYHYEGTYCFKLRRYRLHLVSLSATWGMNKGATGRIRNTSRMVASR